MSRLFAILGLAIFPFGKAVSSFAASPDPAAVIIHWCGMQKIETDTNAAQFMKIWRLPESVAVVNQTLDKLSRWPAGGVTNIVSKRLRPLLDDLASSEFYLKFCSPTHSADLNRKPQTAKLFLLAIHVPANRVELWQTNLAQAFAALTGCKVASTPSGWQITAAAPYGSVALMRSGEWTVLGIGPDVQNLLPAFTGELAALSKPADMTNWLEADFAPGLSPDFSFSSKSGVRLQGSGLDAGLISKLKNAHLVVTAEDGRVVTHAKLALTQLWDASLPDWNIPTNLIHGPLIDFAAVRGMGSWLSGLPVWQKSRLAPAPDQAFLWALDGVPFKTYFMVPMPDASNQLAHLADRLVEQGNPWLATNAQGSFHWDSSQSALIWSGALMINPYLIAGTAGGKDCLMGGLYPVTLAGGISLPANIGHILLNTPDLVYYQSEQTASRVDAALFISQLFRVVFHRAQLPPSEPETVWLKAIQPFLGNCETTIRRTAKQQLTFHRQSTIGLSALELHLLVDWLESPGFPHGLHTFLAPPDAN